VVALLLQTISAQPLTPCGTPPCGAPLTGTPSNILQGAFPCATPPCAGQVLSGTPQNGLPGVVPFFMPQPCPVGNPNCPQQGVLPQGINPITGRPYSEDPSRQCLPPDCDPRFWRPMRIAKVEATPNPFCDCILKPECDCRFEKTVEPELRERVWCGCLNAPGACPCRPSNYQLIKDTCGCLQLQQCPCRMEYVEPETKEWHQEPELKERSNPAPCACMLDAICPCRTATITPEIRDPPCPCAGLNNGMPCGCAGLTSNYVPSNAALAAAAGFGCPCAGLNNGSPCGCASGGPNVVRAGQGVGTNVVIP